MCIDYRKLNEITTKDAYPLPRIGQTIDALQGAGYFSTPDLASGYWHLLVAEKNRQTNCFLNLGGWCLRICENAVWINECAGKFSATHERNFQRRPLQTLF